MVKAGQGLSPNSCLCSFGKALIRETGFTPGSCLILDKFSTSQAFTLLISEVWRLDSYDQSFQVWLSITQGRGEGSCSNWTVGHKILGITSERSLLLGVLTLWLSNYQIMMMS